nr:immunoglobulin light chain junction region [Macaca mulatta]
NYYCQVYDSSANVFF